jgi:hypothetical protein
MFAYSSAVLRNRAGRVLLDGGNALRRRAEGVGEKEKLMARRKSYMEMEPEMRKVVDVFLNDWLDTTEAGRVLVTVLGDKEKARKTLCELEAMEMVEFLFINAENGGVFKVTIPEDLLSELAIPEQ